MLKNFFEIFRRGPARAEAAPLSECVEVPIHVPAGKTVRAGFSSGSQSVEAEITNRGDPIEMFLELRNRQAAQARAGFPELTHERALAARKKMQEPRVIQLPEGTDFSNLM